MPAATVYLTGTYGYHKRVDQVAPAQVTGEWVLYSTYAPIVGKSAQHHEKDGKDYVDYYRPFWTIPNSAFNGFAGATVANGFFKIPTTNVGGTWSVYNNTSWPYQSQSPVHGTLYGTVTDDGTVRQVACTSLIQNYVDTRDASPQSVNAYGISGSGDAIAQRTEPVGTSVYFQFDYFTNTLPGAPGAITSPANGATVDTTANLTIAAAAADVDVPTYQTLTYYWELSRDNGANWTQITTTTALTVAYNFVAQLPTTQAKLRVRAHDGVGYGPYTTQAGTFIIAHGLTTPTGLTPANGASVTTDVPNLGLTLVDSGQQQKAEWQLATDAGFTANVRTITESDADYRISGVTSETVPDASQLFTGTWYVRGRAVRPVGAASAWTAANTFTVAHAPSMANKTPSGGVTRLFDVAGTLLDYDFSDPSPVDAQSARQIQVERNDTFASVVDTGKVVDGVTSYQAVIAAGLKDVMLRWRGRLWDSDDAVGNYSDWDLFRLADAPVVSIDQPAPGALLTRPDPTVTWNVAATGGRTQAERRVRYYWQNGVELVLVHDSGWTPTDVGSYSPPGTIVYLGYTYTITVEVRDTWGLEDIDTRPNLLAQWDSPVAPDFEVTP